MCVNFSESAAGRKVVVIGLILKYRATIPGHPTRISRHPSLDDMSEPNEDLTRPRSKARRGTKVENLWSSSEARMIFTTLVSQKPTGGSHTPFLTVARRIPHAKSPSQSADPTRLGCQRSSDESEREGKSKRVNNTKISQESCIRRAPTKTKSKSRR